jgi:transposase
MLRSTLRSTESPRVLRRVLALLALDEGETVSHVAALMEVTRQTVINWRESWIRSPGRKRAIEEAPRVGRPREWTEERQAMLEALLERSPEQFGYRARSWTSRLLSNHLGEWGGWKPSDRSIRLELKQLGYVYKRPRYILNPDPELSKKNA